MALEFKGTVVVEVATRCRYTQEVEIQREEGYFLARYQMGRYRGVKMPSRELVKMLSCRDL